MDWNNIKRNPWQPNEPQGFEAVLPDLVSRMLSLKDLENVVAELIDKGLNRSDKIALEPYHISELKLNQKDEDVHDRAFTNAVKGMLNYTDKHEVQANNIIDVFNSVPDHPIVKIATLENGLFFVMLPLYRAFGGVPLKITSTSVSRDEIRHVQIHRAIANHLGLKPSKQLMNVILSIVGWLTESIEEEGRILGVETQTRKWYLEQCISLMKDGTSQFTDTQRATVILPFEVPNDSMDGYATN